VRDIVEILEHWYAGRPYQAIAHSLGIDRKTVRKYTAVAKAAGFRPNEGQPPPEGWGPWLDQHCPGLRPSTHCGPAIVELNNIKEEIACLLQQVCPTTAWRRLRQERGLKASLTSFRRYLQRFIPQTGAKQKITVRRPDPPPGDEGQVDYGFLGMWLNPLSGRRQAVNAFAMVLSCSRHTFACAVCGMDQLAWIECHNAAFSFFGGVPRRLVPDNLKAGVLKADLYDPSFNRGYEELSRYYGFLIDPARAAKPTDKPRVERVIPFIRSDFWSGRTFSSLAEINAALRAWCLDNAGMRVHGTTRQHPIEVFHTIEQPTLLPLPADPFERVTWVQAKVARDCHIQAGCAWYSVPYQYKGKVVDVRITTRLVQCYLQYQLVKTHVRVPRRCRGSSRPSAKGERSTDWDDYPPEKAAFFQHTPDWCRLQAEMLGPAIREAVGAVLEVNALHHLRQAQGIIHLADKYGNARLNAACNRAIAYGDPGYRTIKNILVRGLDKQPDPVPVQASMAGAFLRGPEALLASLIGQDGQEGPL
jgi:transposase